VTLTLRKRIAKEKAVSGRKAIRMYFNQFDAPFWQGIQFISTE
jgi:hypothetical protein